MAFVSNSYGYTKLNDATVDKTCHVLAVIKFAKAPSKAKKGYHVCLSLVDESIFTAKCCKIVTNLFINDIERASELRPYRIIRIHRLKIQEYRGKKQGMAEAGCAFVLFDENVGTPLIPICSSTGNFSTVSADETKRIEEIRNWLVKNLMLLESCERSTPAKICEVQPGLFFTFTCQIISCKYRSDLRLYILHVSDGTPVQMHICRRTSIKEVLPADVWEHALLDELEPFVVEIHAEEKLAGCAASLKAGGFAKLINLHAYLPEKDEGERAGMTIAFPEGVAVETVEPTSADAEEISSRLVRFKKSTPQLHSTASHSNFSKETNVLGPVAADDQNAKPLILGPPTVQHVPRMPVDPNYKPPGFKGCKVFRRVIYDDNLENIKKSKIDSGGISNDGEDVTNNEAENIRNCSVISEKSSHDDVDENIEKYDNTSENSNEGDDDTNKKAEYVENCGDTSEKRNIDDDNETVVAIEEPSTCMDTHTAVVDGVNNLSEAARREARCTSEPEDVEEMYLPSTLELLVSLGTEDSVNEVHNPSYGKLDSAVEPEEDVEMRDSCCDLEPSCSQDSECSLNDVRKPWDRIVVFLNSSICCDENDPYYREPSPGYAEEPEKETLTLRTLHDSEETCGLRDVIKTPPPLNFKVKLEILDYFPRPSIGGLFVQMRCPVCGHMQPVKCQKRGTVCTWQCQASCPLIPVCCLKCHLNSKVSQMEHIFSFQLLVKDRRGTQLCVNLYGEEAVKFLGGLCPIKCVSTKSDITALRTIFKRVMGTMVDCCISSALTLEGKVFYQMFDTFVDF